MENKRLIKRKKHLVTFLVLYVMISIVLFACSPSSQKKIDILTQKSSEDGRTQITVLVKYAFGIHDFEEIIEEKFPDIDIVQVGNFTANTALAKEYEARMEHDDLTDIVITWPLEAGEAYWEDRLIDLSGHEFTSKYNTSMLDSIATKEGHLYYLPGPAEIRGIIYNKTMFEENNWAVPSTYSEFITLCKTIEATGIRAFQLPLGNEEVLDTAFIGFTYGNAYSKPEDLQWITDYNDGKGTFIEQFSSSLDTFRNLIDEGVIKKEDLGLYYAQTQDNLIHRKIAMSEESVLMTKYAASMGNKTDEFALMPFFNQIPENDWSRIYMTCYIGLNKHLQEQENQDKYDKVIKIMNFISTTEGQKALASDNGAMYSSLKGMDLPKIDAIEHLRPSLSQGRYGVFPTFKRSKNAFRKGLAAMLKNEMSAIQVAELIDKENKNSIGEQEEIVYASASENFTLIDTGNFICDVLRQEAQSDIALFLDNGKDGRYNGKGVSAKLYKGDVTNIDLLRIFPDLKTEESGELDIVMMSGQQIKQALEYSLSVNNQNNWFYYFSGLHVTMDPLANVGSRIKEVSLSNGEPLNDETKYSVAAMQHSIDEQYITSTTHTEKLIINILSERLKEMKTISPTDDQRLTIYSDH